MRNWIAEINKHITTVTMTPELRLLTDATVAAVNEVNNAILRAENNLAAVELFSMLMLSGSTAENAQNRVNEFKSRMVAEIGASF